jgi:hypothetical protein
MFWEIVLLALGLLLVAYAVSPNVRTWIQKQAKDIGKWLGLGIAGAAAGSAAGNAIVGASKKKSSPKTTEKQTQKNSQNTNNYDETLTRIKSLLHLEGVPSLEAQ